MRPVMMRHLALGTGLPKLCVPLTAKTPEALLAEARSLPPEADLAEWRMDCLDGAPDPGRTAETGRLLRNALPELPLLFTFRTLPEGGSVPCAISDYVKLLEEQISVGLCDGLDIELFTGDDEVRRLTGACRDAGIVSVVSSHDFSATPPEEELLRRLLKAADLGADLPKLAVMPRSARDVLTLLSATLEAASLCPQPVITMSMSALGAVSRVSGSLTGSCLTFGAGAAASAPGQIDARTLRTLLQALRTGTEPQPEELTGTDMPL